jgi:hypothetical protein
VSKKYFSDKKTIYSSPAGPWLKQSRRFPRQSGLKAISVEQRRQAAGRFYLDLATRIKVVAMHDIHFSLAGKLIRHYGFHQALLALDALQLAVASELRRMGLVDWVVSADATLLSVAEAEELPIINPLTL